MPTYQYACTECGHDFEAVQSFSDASLTECPQCEGRLRKVFGAVGIVFKGSGFYRTDSREQKPASTDTAAKTDGTKINGKQADGAKSDGKKSETTSTGKDAGAGAPKSSGSGSSGSSNGSSSGGSSSSTSGSSSSTAGSAA